MTDSNSENDSVDKKPFQRLPETLERSFSELSAPFKEFIASQTTASVILLLATIVAIVLANSSYSSQYQDFFHTSLGFTFGELNIAESLHHWINDCLMALFFFVIGLEIKRAGDFGGGWGNKPRCVRILLIAPGSSIAATTLTCPPQFRHFSTSISNTRLSNRDHEI